MRERELTQDERDVLSLLYDHGGKSTLKILTRWKTKHPTVSYEEWRKGLLPTLYRILTFSLLRIYIFKLGLWWKGETTNE